jgi:uncharacterized membrane protein
MKKNMGSYDQLARLIVAIVIGILYYNGVIEGTLAIILSVLAMIFVLTSFAGYCPIYSLFGINTCGIKNSKGNDERIF